ncbi:MAG: transglutaminase domain-containing protein, partial [Bacteroides sp.]
MVKRVGYFPFVLILLFAFMGGQLVESLSKDEKITSVEASLRSSGVNRKELEKVLHHYQKNPADSLKYKAACFLIENMPFYTYSYGEQLENYKSYYTWLKKSKGKTPQQVVDSIKKIYGPMKEPSKKRDIMEIDSAYLCRNIDWAFKVWQEQPWGKNISFETFCEYLLPYRIGDEPLTYWRETYYEKYNSLLDSLRMSDSLDIEDPVVAANYLISKLPD